MRFVDPLITLWHMGGAIPTHIGMAIYSFTVYDQMSKATKNLEDLTPEKRDACYEDYPKIEISDISYMRYVHIASVAFILSRYFIFEHVLTQFKYLK